MKKCFIIMPYDHRFDDPLGAIRRAVASVRDPEHVETLRLDEDRIAGRITTRLEKEIRDCDLCIADISPTHPDRSAESNPNVMWEIGYAMALGKMPILLSQSTALPFDLRDVTLIPYDRQRLEATLVAPLARAVQATVRHLNAHGHLPGATLTPPRPKGNRELAELQEQVRNLGTMLQSQHELVHAIAKSAVGRQPALSARGRRADPKKLFTLLGAWVAQNGSHIYVNEVDGQLVAPYCFEGNQSLTGVYYDYQSINGWIYARYRWLEQPIEGFSFLRQSSTGDELQGAWWYDGEAEENPSKAPDPSTGWKVILKRTPEIEQPKWASRFIERVRTYGLQKVIHGSDVE